MNISRSDLVRAAAEGLLSADQAEALWRALERQRAGRAHFDMAHLAYYLGALVVMSALGWFVTDAWEQLGGGGLLAVALAYAAAFALAGRVLYFERGLRIPGGLLFTLAVWMTPLGVYGFERMTGLWPAADPGVYNDYYQWVRGGWFGMEVGTVAVGLATLRFVRFPFLTFPLAFALWFMSMDLTPLVYGVTAVTGQERQWVSLWFGLAILLAAYAVDRRTDEDFAFWSYLFGLLAFWGGLSLMQSESELSKFVYCMINVALMVLSVLLDRRAFSVFGALGIFIYLAHLSREVFKDSLYFPFILSAIGLAIIGLGLAYQHNQARIERALVGALPPGVRALLPRERARR